MSDDELEPTQQHITVTGQAEPMKQEKKPVKDLPERSASLIKKEMSLRRHFPFSLLDVMDAWIRVFYQGND